MNEHEGAPLWFRLVFLLAVIAVCYGGWRVFRWWHS